jgi:type IV pilus assembly protein PilQ
MTGGCVKQPKKDAFIEHWDAQTRKSDGYSPSPHPRKVEFSKAAITTKEDKAETKPTRPLPKQKVTLRMYDTDLVSVVRAMARAANQNVVLSSSIPGAGGATGAGQDNKTLRINVNVADAPWDETFQSILSSNGLAYAVEGDIIKVMTLADMEQQNKLKETKNKMAAEAVKAKELEPSVTARVEINYAELSKMYATLSAMCGMSPSTALQQNQSQQTPQGGQTLQPGQAPRDITPTSATDDTIKIQNQAGGTRRPGQLNCSVVPDQHSNSIIIQGPQADAEKLVALIEELDKPRPQVKLKAFIVQTDRETAQQLGVQWGGLLKNSNFQMSPAQAGTISSTSGTSNTGTTTGTSTTTGGTSSSLTTNSTGSNSTTGTSSNTNAMTPIFGGGTSGQGFAINNPASLTSTATGLGAAGTGINFLFGKIGENVLEAQLTALATDSKIKILSSPTITTMENQTAFVENGKDIPYVSTSQNGTNVQFAKATLKLEMLPHVVDGANLRMKIVVKDDQVDPNQTNWVDGNPPIYKRETQSNLVVEDGETIVISGLTRDTVTDGESGVPFLRDIPGLGWAFKSKSSDVHREEMLIFVTPIILREKPIAPVPPVAKLDSAPLAAAAEPKKP